MAGGRDVGDGGGRGGRAYAVEHLQHAEPCDLVARVLGDAQQGNQILHMGGIEEPKPADAPASTRLAASRTGWTDR